MRVIVFAPYYPPHIGGLENYAHELNKNLSRKGVSITVFTPQIPEDSPQKEIKDGITIVRFPAFEIIPNYPLPKFWDYQFWNTLKLIRKDIFDITISHTRFFLVSTSLAYIFSRFHNNKWIHIEHGSAFVQSNNRIIKTISKWYDMTLGRLALNKADQIITVSQSAQGFVRKISKNKKVVTITRGFDYEYIEKIIPENNIDKEIRILFAGRLIDGKGILDLIDAIKIIRNKNIICLIVGDGPQKKILEEKILDENLSASVHLLGHKSYEDLISLMKSVDIVINPSYTEGFSNVIIETGLCKKALITTNVGIAPEIIYDGTNGLIIEMHSPQDLSEKIEKLLNQEILIRKYGESLYETIHPYFDWNKKTDEFLKIFNQCLEK